MSAVATMLLSLTALAVGGLAAVPALLSGRRLRKELRASREAFEALALRAPVGILQADASGMCTFANEAWCRLSGLSLEETLGKAWNHAVHPDDVAGVMGNWEASVREQRSYVNELRVVTQRGEVRWVLATALPMHDAGGRTTGFIGMVMDVTDSKLARESLSGKERLLRRLIDVQEAEKGMLCHEFHDGLIQYAVGSKMMLEGLPREGLPSECRDVLDTVVACLARGVEDGRRAIRGIRPAALDDLGLRAAFEELTAQFTEMGLDVDATIECAVDRLPHGIQTTAYRIVQESLSNARRHSGATVASVRATCNADVVELVVEDRGRGFDPQDIGSGGIGLVGMHERAALVGGECRVESQPGGGTRVVVLLPLSRDGEDHTAES